MCFLSLQVSHIVAAKHCSLHSQKSPNKFTTNSRGRINNKENEEAGEMAQLEEHFATQMWGPKFISHNAYNKCYVWWQVYNQTSRVAETSISVCSLARQSSLHPSLSFGLHMHAHSNICATHTHSVHFNLFLPDTKISWNTLLAYSIILVIYFLYIC